VNPDHAVPPLPIEAQRLILRFNDLSTPREGYSAPTGVSIARLLDFATATPPGGDLLVHCWMGISRSPAAAFILACARNPQRTEGEIAEALRAVSPSATPNAMLVRLADGHLRRG